MKISVISGGTETELLHQMYIVSSWAAKEALNEGRSFCPMYSYDQTFDTYGMFHHHADPFSTKEEIEEHYRENSIGYNFRVCPFCKKNTVSCEGFDVIDYERTGRSHYNSDDKKWIEPIFKCSNHECNDVLDYYGLSILHDGLKVDRDKIKNNRRLALAKQLGVTIGKLCFYETFKHDHVFDVMLYTWVDREAKGCQ